MLKKATVIYVSEMDPEVIKNMHMLPASSLQEGLQMAKTLVKTENPKIVAIPDGISVIVK